VNRKQRRAAGPAQPALPDIFATAVQFHHAGRLAEAEQLYRRVLAAEPRHADSLHRLGVIAYQAGQPASAVELIRQAIAQRAGSAPYHLHLGLALGALGRIDEAVAASRVALKLDPGQPDIHNNLGVLLMQQGQWEEAAQCYRQAIALAPHLPNAHGNLGIVLRSMGKPVEAIACLTRSLEIHPAQPEILSNLALAYLVQGDRKRALDAALRGLALDENPQSRRLFVQCVKDLRFAGEAEMLRPSLLRALGEGWDRPSDLARVSADLIKHSGNVTGDALLYLLLRLTPNLDMELETFLTASRRDLLRDAMREGDTAVPDFYAALAQQCFINEYVFSHSEEEIAQAGALRDKMIAALETDAPISPVWLVAVAAYLPLHSIPSASRLLDRPWPGAVEAILTQQIREPEEERRLRTEIPRLTDINDAGSRAVQAQYEENPYPRWVRAGTADAEDLTGYLRQNFPHAKVATVGAGEGVDILIAGCGTGRNAIETTQKFAGARTLAVDLSRSSLAHAVRKSREMGLEIEYAQADLLALGTLERQFDMIEAVGVLHHLADPLAGWRVLLSLLRPGGVMLLGFYSEVARRNLPRIAGGRADDIRRERQHLLETSDQRDVLRASADFFTTSTCRDLLFHVQEHHLTLAGIGEFLRAHDLTLLGFAADDDVQAAYRRRFPDDASATDLDHWQAFEADNPDAFAGMYQFWVQKRA
jgi:tetratricopeptide (TPR) repeat protein/SAM-dependent methyltransferase